MTIIDSDRLKEVIAAMKATTKGIPGRMIVVSSGIYVDRGKDLCSTTSPILFIGCVGDMLDNITRENAVYNHCCSK